MKKIKLIWDFKGQTAEKTSEHHVIHLNEFIESEKLEFKITGSKTISEFHSVAFMVVSEAEMIPVRDALKPHRGEIYTDL
ncbi:MAG: hypothetical protein ACI9XR_001115 [Flavobacterium sp.]